MLDEPTPRKAIEFAVKTEELGNIFYSKLAKKFSKDEEINNVFSTLAKDETAHKKQFEELLEKIPEDSGGSNRDDRSAFLRMMSRSEFFMGESGIYKKLEEIKTPEDALERAFQLEKDTLGYYHALQDIVGENKILQAVIDAEKSHVIKIMEYMITGAKMRGLGDS